MIRLDKQLPFEVAGDGTATSITFDLVKPPISLDLGGKHPSGVKAISPEGSSATIQGTKVTFVFATAPQNFSPDGTVTGASIVLLFDGD